MAEQIRVVTNDQTSNFSMSAGTDRYALMDEGCTGNDGDTTYCYHSATKVNQDCGFTAFSITSSSIDKVTVCCAMRDEGTSAGVKLLMYVGAGSTRYSGGAITTTSSYVTYLFEQLTNPADGLDWEEDEVEGGGTNPLQYIGIRHNDATAAVVRYSALECMVTYTEAGAGISIPVAMHHYTKNIGSRC